MNYLDYSLKFEQQDETAKACGFLDYSFIHLFDYFKFTHYAFICLLAMDIGCCDYVFNF